MDEIWAVIKYIGIGLASLISMFFLWFIGRFWGEHLEMYKQFIERNSPAAKALKDRQIADHNELMESLKKLQHEVAALRQDRVNLKIVFDQLDHISKKIDVS